MSRHFPSAWAIKKLADTSTGEWVEDSYGGFNYFFRVIKANDGVAHHVGLVPSLKCKVSFRASITKEGDEVILNGTDFDKISLDSAMLVGVQQVLLQMGEGDKCEAIFPNELAYGAEHPEDIYVEVELKNIGQYTGVVFTKPDLSSYGM